MHCNYTMETFFSHSVIHCFPQAIGLEIKVYLWSFPAIKFLWYRMTLHCTTPDYSHPSIVWWSICWNGKVFPCTYVFCSSRLSLCIQNNTVSFNRNNREQDFSSLAHQYFKSKFSVVGKKWSMQSDLIFLKYLHFQSISEAL